MGSKSLFKSISTDSVIYGVMKYFTVLVSIVLTPIYTRILTKEDFGIMDAFNIWNAMIISVLHLGLYNAILRYYPEIKDNIEEKRKILGSILSVLLLMAGIYAILILGLKALFLNTYIGKTNQDAIFYYSIVIVFLSVLYSYCLYLLQTQFEKYKYAAVTLVNFCLLASLGFYYVYLANEGISGFFKASCIGLLAADIVGFYFLRKEFYLAFDSKKVKNMLSYSIHFITVSFLLTSSNVLDRYLIKHYLSLSDIGVYSIAMRVSNFLQIAIGSFGTAWMPYAMSIAKKEGDKNIYAKVFELYMVVLCALIALILIFRRELLLFFAPNYLESYNTIAVLLLCNFVIGLVYVLAIGLHVTKKTSILSWAALISISINFIVSISLVKNMGINGIAIGTLIGSLVWVFIQHRQSQKYYHIPFSYLKAFFIGLFLILPITFTSHIDKLISNEFLLIGFKLLISLIISALVYTYMVKNKSLQKLK